MKTTDAAVFTSSEPLADRRLLVKRGSSNLVRAITCRRDADDDAVVEVERGLARRELLRQRLVWHSPDGFEWGFAGSGPHDLALNILALFVCAPEAWRLHWDFCSRFLFPLPHAGGVLLGSQVIAWLEEQWRVGV